MPRVSKTFCILLLSLICQAEMVVASTYAVIVGISNYQKFQAGKGDLFFANRDARLMHSYLTAPDGLKIPKENVILLTDAEATKPNILKALELFEKAKPDDQVIFFFSGHGNKGVFLPYESSGIRPLVTHQEIKQKFRSCRAQQKICIADACMSGTIQIRSFPEEETLSKTDNTNILVFLSSLSNQVSVEYRKLGQGVFTYFLLMALKGAADQDNDRTITALELYQFVSQRVRSYSKQNDPARKEQIPIMFGRFPKDLPIARLP